MVICAVHGYYHGDDYVRALGHNAQVCRAVSSIPADLYCALGGGTDNRVNYRLLGEIQKYELIESGVCREKINSVSMFIGARPPFDTFEEIYMLGAMIRFWGCDPRQVRLVVGCMSYHHKRLKLIYNYLGVEPEFVQVASPVLWERVVYDMASYLLTWTDLNGSGPIFELERRRRSLGYDMNGTAFTQKYWKY